MTPEEFKAKLEQHEKATERLSGFTYSGGDRGARYRTYAWVASEWSSKLHVGIHLSDPTAEPSGEMQPRAGVFIEQRLAGFISNAIEHRLPSLIAEAIELANADIEKDRQACIKQAKAEIEKRSQEILEIETE